MDDGWKPIETAPFSLPNTAAYWMLVVSNLGYRMIACREHDGTWTRDDGQPIPRPAGWMPLPDVPDDLTLAA